MSMYTTVGLVVGAVAAMAGVVGAVGVTGSAAGAIRTERVEYRHGDSVLEGVVAYDDAAKEPRAGVLVCPEWWGNNAYAERRATMLAELGYVALAIDMYGKGKVTTDPKQAAEWAGQVFSDNAALRARAAAGLEVLASRKDVDKTRLAAIGYCMGGTVALELARSGLKHTENLKAVVAFHASTIAAGDAKDNANIKGTVMICHGQDDFFVKPEQIPAFHEQMKAAQVDYVFISYGGAVHAFTNPDADKAKIDGVKYDAAADRRSWEAMRALFAEKLAAKW